MSGMVSTRNVEIELRLFDGCVELYVCDAQVSQWEERIATLLDNWTPQQIEEEVTHEIESCAADLAKSLVKDLYESVIPEMNGGK